MDKNQKITLEELVPQLDGLRSVMLGRAYRGEAALLAAQVKHATGPHLYLFKFDGQALEVLEGPVRKSVGGGLDIFQSSIRGSDCWPLLLGPDELRRKLLLYHGPEASTEIWLKPRLPHKLPNHPVIPSAHSCALLDNLLTVLYDEGTAGLGDGEPGSPVDVNQIVTAALLARQFSDAALLCVGLKPDDLLYRHMLRHPDLTDLSDRFMDATMEAHLDGRMQQSQESSKAATEAPKGV